MSSYVKTESLICTLYNLPLLNLLNQPIALVNLFMINITPNISYFCFIFSAYFLF